MDIARITAVPAAGPAANWSQAAVAIAPLQARYAVIRARSMAICEGLSAEDCQAQSAPQTSPLKWHLAHTTCFLEAQVLAALPGYRPGHLDYTHLFTAGHATGGSSLAPAQRGLLSRPSLQEVLDYRAQIDAALDQAMGAGDLDAEALAMLELGLQHEERHQELMLADLKHLLGSNPLLPSYRELPAPAPGPATACDWVRFGEGFADIGHAGGGFAFANERPRHRVWLSAFALASRCVSNGEYQEFMRAGGYRTPRLWSADGWAALQEEQWTRPLYWSEDAHHIFTLAGLRPLDPQEPVSHISYYEAEAFARWAGARLPREEEWEHAAEGAPVQGNFLDSGRYHPRAPLSGAAEWYGNVWQWTASPHSPYPGHHAEPEATTGYGAAFACNRLVLRGGSCASRADHLRSSYRHFLMPRSRWHFSGLRLAKDLT